MIRGTKDYHRRVYEFLETLGATDIAYRPSNGHGRFTFRYQGREFRCSAPGSPSDRRAHKNAIAEIKRMIRT